MTTSYHKEMRNALRIAQQAHAGQVRVIGADLGLPYFDTHVMRVVRAVPDFAKPAAALHDVVEDTGVTLDDLIRHAQGGLIEHVTVAAVSWLTRKEGQSYDEYIDILRSMKGAPGRIARAVKLADLCDNLSTLPEGSLRGRYISALAMVATAIEDRDMGA